MDPLRAKAYDADPIRRIQERLASIENRLQRLERTQARRYANLRGFRTRAIRALYGMEKLTLGELGVAFGITKQRIAQIVGKKAT
jgi:DNA-directed RNA polymerase sigma subunit (sigma70/sigma32)